MNKLITSLVNPLVKHVVSLATRKGRSKHKQFVVEGQRMIKAFLDAGKKPVYFFISEKRSLFDFGIEHEDKECSIYVSDRVMQKMSTATTPSGLLAVFETPQSLEVSTLSGPAIVLLEVSDPGNMGTLIRTAVALNFSIVLIGGVDCWSPKVVQASAGALSCAQIIESSWYDLVFEAKKQNVLLSALVVRDGIDPSDADLSKKSLLVIGSEAHGIRQSYLRDCQQKITLSMSGNTESLNAAIAGSIAMYLQNQKY